jgi:hypothetical protein
MADTTLELDPGSGGATLAVDDIAGAIYQYIAMVYGGSGSKTAVSNSNPLPTKITDGTDTALVTAAGELHVSNITPLAAGTNAIGKLAPNSGVDIGDVDVTSLPSTVHSADFDTGGGTDTTLAFGIAVPAAGGAAVVPGSATDGLTVNLGSNNDVTVTGTVDLGATDNGVLDAIAASTAAADADLTTLIGHVDGLEGLVGTTNTNTGNAATSLAIMDDWDNAASDGASVSGDVAHDAVDAGEPVKIGGYAKAAAPTDVSADGDRVNAWFDLAGRQAVFDGGLSLSIDDGGNVITVDGTVAVTNAGLTELAAAVNGSAQMDVNIAASGATIPVSHAALTELSAAINGSSQMDVNVAAALPAGTNLIGNVKISDGTDTADVLDLASSNPLAVAIVDANGDQISSFGGGTEYTVDAAAPANPVGATFVMERDDQLSTVAEAAGDWTNARATAKGALWVALADSAGDPITSFGGGSQYTEGDTDASITGTALLWEDTSDTLRAVSAAKPLPVSIISQVQPVGASNIVTGQAAPTNSAATLVASRATRTRLTMVNRGSVSVYVGPATVTTANGVELKPGESMTFEMAGTTLQGITASGTGNIHYWEEYN